MRWLAGFPAIAWLVAAPGSAATFTVDSTVDAVDRNPGDGVCASTLGGCTLRAAIHETNALAGPDVLALPTGMYLLTILPVFDTVGETEDPANDDSGGDLDIRDHLTLAGEADTDDTVIDQTSLFARVVEIHGAIKVDIRALTVTGGGGGVLTPGGGIRNDGGNLSLIHTQVTGNTAGTFGRGGGIFNGSSGRLYLLRSAVSGNIQSAG